MRWDVFCRVIDNFGDVGVAWRFASDLARRGEAVRLYVDDASALAWMAPGPREVDARAWEDAELREAHGEVVVETFGCGLPAPFLARMAASPTPPVWIDLEYLSAEPYVERSHALPSPQTVGPGAGLVRWFWFPGFTSRTGGLLREPDLLERQRAFDRHAWLAAHARAPRPGERIVSLFCYEQPRLAEAIAQWAQRPTLLLATPGPAAEQVRALLGPSMRRGVLEAVALPALPQPAFDELLWAADLNFVRGEDSFVRAQWAGRPFVWQIYPQHDAAHRGKLDAFLTLSGASLAVARFARAWNGFEPGPLPPLPSLAEWTADARRWRDVLAGLPDLSSGIRRFAAERR